MFGSEKCSIIDGVEECTDVSCPLPLYFFVKEVVGASDAEAFSVIQLLGPLRRTSIVCFFL